MDLTDICLLLLDAGKGITAQDLAIFQLAAKREGDRCTGGINGPRGSGKPRPGIEMKGT